VFSIFFNLRQYFLVNLELIIFLSQINYLLAVILELSGVSEVQYKEIMIIDVN